MHPLYDASWKPREPTPEEEAGYAGSVWESLGYERTFCPKCGSHTMEGMCLNGCHLVERLQKKFKSAMTDGDAE